MRCLLLYVGGIVPLVPMVAAWAILIDAPHVFGTFSRTYFDRAERRPQASALGFAALLRSGPLMVLRRARPRLLFPRRALGLLPSRQAALRLHGALQKEERRSRAALTTRSTACCCCSRSPILSSPSSRAIRKRWRACPPRLQSGVGYVGDRAARRDAARRASPGSLDRFSAPFAGNPRTSRSICCSPLRFRCTGSCCLTPMPHKPIAIVAILTIYHNLQYHRLIWFHNQKYAAQATTRRERLRRGGIHQPSPPLLHRLRHSLRPLVSTAAPVLSRSRTDSDAHLLTQLVAAFFWGYAFIHYYLDSKIWRVRRDPSVGKALRME